MILCDCDYFKQKNELLLLHYYKLQSVCSSYYYYNNTIHFMLAHFVGVDKKEMITKVIFTCIQLLLQSVISSLDDFFLVGSPISFVHFTK